MQVISDLQQCQKQVEQERNNVTVAETGLAQAETLLAANSYLFWRKKLGSEKDVNAARSTLERYKKNFSESPEFLGGKRRRKTPGRNSASPPHAHSLKTKCNG